MWDTYLPTIRTYGIGFEVNGLESIPSFVSALWGVREQRVRRVWAEVVVS
jgi:hypothetical protein